MESEPQAQPPEARPVRNREELESLVRERIGNRLFVAVSNREPFVHVYGPDGSVETQATVGGLALALNSAMEAVRGVWVAYGGGEADREASDARGCVRVPPGNPSYDLQRVWLDPDEYDGYYNGFANQALWPLCHNAFTKPVFREQHWAAYKQVNERFATAVADRCGNGEAIVFVQDYHFALLPAMLRDRLPGSTILHFWHIPWPVPDILEICPWHGEIMDGLLGADVFGVHTPRYAERFRAAAALRPGWTSGDRGSLVGPGRDSRVESFPISIDFEGISERAAAAECDAAVERLRQEYGLEGRFVVLGLDRIDYTKGVVERLRAVERLLESHPELRGRLAFVYAGAPSRTSVPAYRELHESMDRIEARINAGSKGSDAMPVVSLRRQLSETEVLALYRLADVCVVSSLEDGMNLVAKEFIAARNDGGGRLLLSRFTGAAWELPDAETFNPFDTDRFATLLFAASEADAGEGAERMRRLREHVREHNIYGWIGSILETLPENKGSASK